MGNWPAFSSSPLVTPKFMDRDPARLELDGEAGTRPPGRASRARAAGSQTGSTSCANRADPRSGEQAPFASVFENAWRWEDPPIRMRVGRRWLETEPISDIVDGAHFAWHDPAIRYGWPVTAAVIMVSERKSRRFTAPSDHRHEADSPTSCSDIIAAIFGVLSLPSSWC